MYLGKVLSFLCYEYKWTPEYILKKLTWRTVWKYYEYGLHYQSEGKYVIDQEPDPITNLSKDVKNINGKRIISK
jgi:hypothetical protein